MTPTDNVTESNQPRNPGATGLMTKQAPAYIAAIEGIVEQREEARAREREVIDGLNSALAKIGYKIVPLRGMPKPELRLATLETPDRLTRSSGGAGHRSRSPRPHN